MKHLKNLAAPEYLMLVSVTILLLIASSVLNKHKSENESVGSSYKLPDLISQIP